MSKPINIIKKMKIVPLQKNKQTYTLKESEKLNLMSLPIYRFLQIKETQPNIPKNFLIQETKS